MGWIKGKIPKGKEQGLLLICDKCGFRNIFHGSVRPKKKEKCPGCKLEKENKDFVQRNPPIIHRNNPGPYQSDYMKLADFIMKRK